MIFERGYFSNLILPMKEKDSYDWDYKGNEYLQK